MNVDSQIIDATTQLRYEKDKAIVTHIQDTDLSAAEAKHDRINSINGFSKKRLFRKIASIPAIFFQIHPELEHDDKALRKWIDTHKEFKSCDGNI